MDILSAKNIKVLNILKYYYLNEPTLRWSMNELINLRKNNAPACCQMPSLRSGRRSLLSRVWQRSKESRGNGEEGRSYRHRRTLRFRHGWERNTPARTPFLTPYFFVLLCVCVLICSLANRQRTLIVFCALYWGRIPNFFSDLTWTWLETVLV